MKPNYLAALVLFFLPVISVELLTGNTPLDMYFNPPLFITFNILYGGAALLVRETAVRWGRSMTPALMLAAGYGMVNEALGSKGFFTPHFYSAVQFHLEQFGYIAGINTAWAVNISTIHLYASILVPVLLVSALFYGSRGPWLGNAAYRLLIGLFVLNTAFVFFIFPPHVGFGAPLALILALIAGVIALAWKMPDVSLTKWQAALHPLALFFTGAVGAFAFFITPELVRGAGASAGAYIAFIFAIFWLVPAWLYLKIPEPPAVGKAALATGILTPFLFNGFKAGNVVPALIVAALVALVLWRSTGAGSPTPATT